MKVTQIGKIEITPVNKMWYPEMTGETITIEYEEGIKHTYIVLKGRFTKYGSVRDCGDHYIKANYSSYDRINKKTLEITRDVEDR